MSTTAEVVEAEATEPDSEEEEAEATEPDSDEPEADEPEAEPEAFTQIGPEEIRKAERAIEGQRKRIGGILGPEAVAHECLLCAGLGFLPDLPPVGTTFSIVLSEDGPQLLAQEPLAEPDYKQAIDKQMCPVCDGQGQTLTGSKAEFARLAPCSRCNGNGWVQLTPTPENVNTGYATATPTTYTLPPPPPPVSVDPWGREPGHQHYGIAPNLITG